MIEPVLAGLVLAVCAVLGVRLLIGARRRQRFDAALRRGLLRLRHTAGAWRRWRSARRDAEQAARVADEAIRRARRRSEREGNVYTPKEFRKPPRDKMH